MSDLGVPGKAILLDAGGVLLDEAETERIVCEIAVSVLRRVRPEYCERDYWADVDESVVRFAPQTLPYVIWKNCRGDRGLYDRLWPECRARRSSEAFHLVLMKGIDTELIALSGHFKLVLAGQYGPAVYELLDRHGIGGLFANRLSQADFTITKPDPRYVQEIARRAGLDSRECVMVGDRIDKDVIPARQNGMGTVLVRTGIHRNQMPRTPDEIPDIDLPGVEGMAGSIMERWT